MKKLFIVLTVLMLASPAYAFSSRDITAEGTSKFLQTTVTNTGKYLGIGTYYTVRYTLKALAVPFYWLEKVAK